jgi:hypothetical protein
MIAPRTWRTSGAARGFVAVVVFGLLALGAVLLVAAVAAIVNGQPAAAAGLLAVAVVVPLGAWPLWRLAFAVSITLEPTKVVIRNPAGTRVVSLEEISAVRPGYYGLTFVLTGGRQVTAWAVQKWNLATWLRLRTRADEIADEILAARPSRPTGQ